MLSAMSSQVSVSRCCIICEIYSGIVKSEERVKRGYYSAILSEEDATKKGIVYGCLCASIWGISLYLVGFSVGFEFICQRVYLWLCLCPCVRVCAYGCF